MIKEFKEFIAKGNVMDMAVGVIIGGAFGKIVTSLVNDLLMPLISLILGGVDFSNLFIALDGGNYASLAAAEEAGAALFKYGAFIQNVIDFLIIAFCIFLMVKAFNKSKKEEPAAAPTTKACPYCKSEIAIDAVKCPHCTADLSK
ncbi:large conductance mechanosensitive channel protein MscL [uncultured Ezakiella sp.]|uniref:large conductance mechanosensitive channel protein MscL n=1 Tax=uncultured Ezakiella sp. TaxID=1637529 RepID=UPI0025FCDCF2|nr:large conductance mechanosensitive channel protein MscL [uncultured Ezakiella sp.]